MRDEALADLLHSASLDAMQLRIGRELARCAVLLLEDAFGRCTHPAGCAAWATVRHYDEGGPGWPEGARVRRCEAHFREDRDGELAIRQAGDLRSNKPHGVGPWVRMPWFRETEELVMAINTWEAMEEGRERAARGVVGG